MGLILITLESRQEKGDIGTRCDHILPKLNTIYVIHLEYQVLMFHTN